MGFAVGQAGEEGVEVGAGERPVEGLGDLAVVGLEGSDPRGQGVEVGEVVGGQRFALEDREVDLDLVEPGRVDRQVDQARVLVGVLESGDER